MKQKRFYSHLILSTILGGVFLFVIFFSLNLNSDRFAKEFYSQNYQNIESGNAFALIPQLNSLINQDVIACMEGRTSGQIFFSSKHKCDRSIFEKDINLASNSGVSIHLRYTLSTAFFAYLTSAFLFILLASNIILRMIFKLEDAERKSLSRINELSRNVAHDIRSPLSALNSVVRSASNLNPEYKDILIQVASRINGIADDLLENNMQASKSHLAQPEKKQLKTDLKSVLEKITAEKSLEYKKNLNVSISLRSESLTAPVNLDFPDRDLMRIISNLINNSVEAIQGEGQVTVQAHVKSGNAIVTITDNGSGIPEDILENIFTNQITTKASGSGIGISSAYQTMKKYGGDLKIQSRMGIGTQVTLYIPITHQQ